MNALAQAIAILSAALFGGAALYINLAEHPARMQCGTELAATVFPPSYRRAAAMQATLAVVGTLAGVVAWIGTGDRLWLLGSALIFAVVPFTLIVILPTNRELLAPDLDRRSPRTRALLERWGRLHAVRSVAGIGAAAVFLFAAAG